MENIIKTGELNVLSSKHHKDECWESRYFVLCANKLPRLDWYSCEGVFLKKPTDRKTVYLKDIEHVNVGLKSVLGRNHTFEITNVIANKQEQHTYSADTETEVQDWVNHIKSLQKDMAIDKDRKPAVKIPNVAAKQSVINNRHLHDGAATLSPNLLMSQRLDVEQDCLKYKVTVSESNGQESCGLVVGKNYWLFISTLHMVLMEGEGSNQKELFTWPYKFIRRYGRSAHTFTFEAGRKCDSGDGLFTFKLDDGEKIFHEVHLKTKAMKNSQSNTLPISPPSSPAESPPSVPQRKYGDADAKGVEIQKKLENEKPSTPNPQDKEKHKKYQHHGVKAIKETFKHIGDKVSDTLHISDRKSKDNCDDPYKRSATSLTVDDSGVMGTAGKYSSSPNMKQRCLPAIPVTTTLSVNSNENTKLQKSSSVKSDHIYEDAETITNESDVFPHTCNNEYALYDQSYSSTRKPYSMDGNDTDLYEDQGQCDSGVNEFQGEYSKAGRISRSFSAKSNESGFEEEQEHYASIDEADKMNFFKQNQHRMETLEQQQSSTFKMSDVLSQTKSDETSFDDVDGLMPDYDYAYAGEYDSIDFLKGHTEKSKLQPSAICDDGTYGMLSLGRPDPNNAKQDEVSYINTSKMSKKS